MPVTICGAAHNILIESFPILNYSKGVSDMNQQIYWNDAKPDRHAAGSALQFAGSMRHCLWKSGLTGNTNMDRPDSHSAAFPVPGFAAPSRFENCRTLFIRAL